MTAHVSSSQRCNTIGVTAFGVAVILLRALFFDRRSGRVDHKQICRHCGAGFLANPGAISTVALAAHKSSGIGRNLVIALGILLSSLVVLGALRLSPWI